LDFGVVVSYAAVVKPSGGLDFVSESYPDLKSNQNFMQLQTDITDTEDKIQASRRFYNGAARDLNIKVQVFPTNIFAGMLGFKEREFFDVAENERTTIEKPTDVNFDDEDKEQKS
jgi:LemA protein